MLYKFLVVYFIGISSVYCCLEFPEGDIKMQVGKIKVMRASLYYSFTNNANQTIELIPEHQNVISLSSSFATPNVLEIDIVALSAGKSEISVVCRSNVKNETSQSFMLVQVHHSQLLETLSVIIGWLYFLCWSICFYPQIYDNYKAKSVVGLNFDTVTFSLFGYLTYNTFNVAMTYSTDIKRQYSQRYPKGITPVLTNDLVFSMHSVVASAAVAYQCLVYYKEKQAVSRFGATIVVLCCLGVATSSVLALLNIILWLDVVYLCSYIKMYGNVMTYVPQVLMNYRRRSTTGFSIIGVIIDLLGGIFSMIQMFMDGYNYDDWKTIFENPTKFGIGVMTLLMAAVFIVQHYLLYPEERSKDKHVELKTRP